MNHKPLFEFKKLNKINFKFSLFKLSPNLKFYWLEKDLSSRIFQAFYQTFGVR